MACPELLARHELVTVPGYRLVTVRDQENDAGAGLDEALARAAAAVVASTGYELVISCAQDLLPVAVRLQTWSARPEDGDDEPEWSVPQEFQLECPSGLAVVGSPTGDVLDVPLPAGPGAYGVDVVHQGRERALAARQDVLGHEDLAGRKQELVDAQPGGFERYRVRLWFGTPLPDDEDW
ncbi:hypothetical protein [Lentzea sp.]|uniref:hypothetical protein n=1 Tax=Lentzea sp. TaxID=56099 RepID=UPI002ED648D0